MNWLDRISRINSDTGRLLPWVGSLLFILMPTSSSADTGDDFVEHVLPVLADRCFQCHGEKRQKGGLRLDSLAAVREGGDSGMLWAAGESQSSLLLQRITSADSDERMPPKGDPLSAEQIASISAWIEAGASLPSVATADWDAAAPAFWSLRPLSRPDVPSVPASWNGRVRNPIDHFVLHRLAEEGLAPSDEASRRILIRRLYFDLLGLPPSPERVERFVANADPRAYERLVDELLASPLYGERWARHWLDLVHFGETHGYDKDKPRPNAWPYRDYVIRAFNSDRSYTRFVREQIAGDVLYPGTLDGLAATGFISAGPWDFIGHAEVPESKIDGQVARNLDRDDMVSVTMNTFTSMTVQCARCHDHKFDPVSMEDYYSLQANFAALDRSDTRFDSDPDIRVMRADLEERIRGREAERDGLKKKITELGGDDLTSLDGKIRELERPSEKHPAFGYHSLIESDPHSEKWVQIDLGGTVAAERIEYFPADDDYNGIGAGFGFPVRYRIEVSAAATFAAGAVVVADYTSEDVTNPLNNRQRVLLNGKPIRFIRLTATKLAPRSDDFIFALAELMVRDSEGRNVAQGKTVTALDSIESGVRWGRNNLVDGVYPGVKQQSGDRELELAALQAERAQLLLERVPPNVAEAMAACEEVLTGLRGQLTGLPSPMKLFVGRVHTGSGAFQGTGAQGGKPRVIRVLHRGDITSPREVVEPGTVDVYEGGRRHFELPSSHREGERRVALSAWILDDANPLTWRSIVNRLWQHHFGRGIVDSPNDFGRMGQRPTHPQLLDWLAIRFRDEGQSMKAMHRLMLTSATYRQNSVARPEAMAIDGGNRFLWRMPRRRLDAESIRDSVLWLADSLNSEMYGPSFQDFVVEKPEHSPHYQYHLHDPRDERSHRRSIYRFLVRSQQQPFMTTLDCADPSMMVDKRSETLTPLQALSLMNNRFMTVMADRMGQRIRSDEAGAKTDLRQFFRRLAGRFPEADELALLVDYAARHGAANACRVMLNLNEFVFVD